MASMQDMAWADYRERRERQKMEEKESGKKQMPLRPPALSTGWCKFFEEDNKTVSMVFDSDGRYIPPGNTGGQLDGVMPTVTHPISPDMPTGKVSTSVTMRSGRQRFWTDAGNTR